MTFSRNSTIKVRTYKQGPKYLYTSYDYSRRLPLLKYILVSLLIMGLLAGLGYGIYRLVIHVRQSQDVKSASDALNKAKNNVKNANTRIKNANEQLLKTSVELQHAHRQKKS